MNFRNAKYNEFGSIDCEIEHPAHGWMPFTASPEDVEPLGKEVFDAAKDVAEPYVTPPEPTPEEVRERLATEVRVKRNSLLQQSDWTQVADAPVDQAAWATYRQALRDVTAQDGFPEAVVWPVAPN